MEASFLLFPQQLTPLNSHTILLSICSGKDNILWEITNIVRIIEEDAMKVNIKNCVLELLEGDITEMASDAIVNAANSHLILGGGVAGAIRKKGGPKIQEECHEIGSTFVGGAVITCGGDLKAKHVIHAVGPRMGEGDEDEKLKNATLNSLKVADDNSLKSISFPAISTGIFGFPINKCAEIMLRTVIDYLEDESGLERVVLCLFGNVSYEVFEQQLSREMSK